VEAIAAAYVAPQVVSDSGAIGSARTTPASVVLQAALNVIERHPIICMDLIELAHRCIENRFPVLRAIVRNRQAAVLADPNPAGILRIDPHSVKIAVNRVGDTAPIATAVNRRR